ncbi:NAD-binding protein [Vararia minispora EC-137]|uniref:NAD-binding protein n=1 Tax=Vararia minispora EC-137 TaxID=1314806 RepID=A0ACB8QUG0_9AGAM|nr:NAD-binding protein [Vararia minispora EC-137]
MQPESSLAPANLFNVDGLVAVITGGGTGIGLMMAAALENNGATVYIVGRRKDVLDRAVHERSRHGKMRAVKCDVTCREQLLELAQTVRTEQGRVDLLVNNAGAAYGVRQRSTEGSDVRALQAALWDSAGPEDFARCFDINVTATYYTTIAFLDLLAAANDRRPLHSPTSQVITVSSVAALRRDERQYSIPYALSKSAVVHLAKMFVNIFKDLKIRSNVICPGIYPSEMTTFLKEEAIREGVPLQRAGTQEDMAGLILFLASPAGAYVDGTVHITDGGRLSLFPSTY